MTYFFWLMDLCLSSNHDTVRAPVHQALIFFRWGPVIDGRVIQYLNDNYEKEDREILADLLHRLSCGK